VQNTQTVLYVRSAETRGFERNQLHTEDRPLSLQEKLHDKDYYDKGAFLGRVAEQHPLKQGLKATKFKTQRAVIRL
jgi:hypothetical protein